MALFPHVLTKNVAFECNFGALVSAFYIDKCKLLKQHTVYMMQFKTISKHVLEELNILSNPSNYFWIIIQLHLLGGAMVSIERRIHIYW